MRAHLLRLGPELGVAAGVTAGGILLSLLDFEQTVLSSLDT